MDRWQSSQVTGPALLSLYERFRRHRCSLAVATAGPQALVLVDRDRARSLRYMTIRRPGLWDGIEPRFVPSCRCRPHSKFAAAHQSLRRWLCDLLHRARRHKAPKQVGSPAGGAPPSTRLISARRLPCCPRWRRRPALARRAAVHYWQRGIILMTTSGLCSQTAPRSVCALARRGLFGQVKRRVRWHRRHLPARFAASTALPRPIALRSSSQRFPRCRHPTPS